MNKHNPYGYKIGYRENGSHTFVRYFMTYTYSRAKMCLRHYRKTPPRERETNRPLINPFWEIKPITQKEILAGIWDEIPFPYFNPFFAFLGGAVLHILRKNVHAHREIKYRLKSEIRKTYMQYFPLTLLKSTLRVHFCFFTKKKKIKSQDMRLPFRRKAKKNKKRRFLLCTKKIKTS